MDNVSSFFESVQNFFATLIKSVRFIDILDIIMVALIIYGVIRLVRDSRAEQLLKGIMLFVLAFFLSSRAVFDLKSMNYLLNTVFDNMLIVMIVIFQPEIRRALEQLGHSSAKGLSFIHIGSNEEKEVAKTWEECIGAISSAVAMLRQNNMGALIVCERTTKLGEIVKTGTVVDAKATPQLIENIFFVKSPLHDGAMIIRDGRVHAAGCILPLSESFDLSRQLGTRHRAAVGISENSDAVAVVVSEETGLISIAIGGELKRNYSPKALQIALENALIRENNRKDSDDSGESGGQGKKKSKLFRRKKQ